MAKVKDLLNDETKWTRGAFARDASDNEVKERDDKAVCWCLIGAIWKCYDNPTALTIHQRLRSELRTSELFTWNDTHTFDEIKALVISLDI